MVSLGISQHRATMQNNSEQLQFWATYWMVSHIIMSGLSTK